MKRTEIPSVNVIMRTRLSDSEKKVVDRILSRIRRAMEEFAVHPRRDLPIVVDYQQLGPITALMAKVIERECAMAGWRNFTHVSETHTLHIFP